MTLNPQALSTALLIPLILFALYRRFRRNFGRQPVRRKRLMVRIVALTLAGFGVASSVIATPEFLGAAGGGLAAGIILALVGLRHTRFEATTEGEYYTHPSRTTVCPGPIVMELKNDGQDDHDLKVLDVDHGTVVATWAIAHPGDAVQKHLTLPAGTYRLFCTLSDGNGAHDDLGMHAVITVG